jgi:hypothetical protein
MTYLTLNLFLLVMVLSYVPTLCLEVNEILFSLLLYHNRYINALEALGGPASLAQGLDRDRNTSIWGDALEALAIGINQVSFSGWKPEECIAIGNELLSWKQKGLSETEGAFSP